MPTMSPSDNEASSTRWPFTYVPFELPRSTIFRSGPSLRISAWFREALASPMMMSLSGARPIRTMRAFPRAGWPLSGGTAAR
jgi:hypothetical protein